MRQLYLVSLIFFMQNNTLELIFKTLNIENTNISTYFSGNYEEILIQILQSTEFDSIRSQAASLLELLKQIQTGKNNQITELKSALEHTKHLKHFEKEHLIGIYLNSKNEIIHKETISIGGINSNNFHPREIFKPAITYGATNIILAHNHPTGDATPSKSDIISTRKLLRAAKILRIELVDHIIIGKDNFSSLKKLGIIA